MYKYQMNGHGAGHRVLQLERDVQRESQPILTLAVVAVFLLLLLSCWTLGTQSASAAAALLQLLGLH